MDIGGTIHTTILRKSAVSGVHCATNSSETHSDLADLMAHDVATARHYYKLNEKSKSSVKASRQLTQMCHAWFSFSQNGVFTVKHKHGVRVKKRKKKCNL